MTPDDFTSPEELIEWMRFCGIKAPILFIVHDEDEQAHEMPRGETRAERRRRHRQTKKAWAREDFLRRQRLAKSKNINERKRNPTKKA